MGVDYWVVFGWVCVWVMVGPRDGGWMVMKTSLVLLSQNRWISKQMLWSPSSDVLQSYRDRGTVPFETFFKGRVFCEC